MFKHFILFILTLLTGFIFGQNVGINQTGAAPNNSSILDVSSTDKGILIPRVDIIDLNTAAPITAPAISLMVYNTNITSGIGYYYWDGTKWVKILDNNSNSDEDWYQANTINSPNDINDDVFTNGKVGIGLNNPSQALDIFNGNIELDSEFGIGRNHGSATSEWAIKPYRTGLQALGQIGPLLPHDVGMSLESDALITLIETDNDDVVGWFDVNSDFFIWDGRIGLGTENPSAQLNIKGDARIRLDNNINHQWDINIDNTNGRFLIQQLTNLTFTANRFVIDTLGHVGIGTSLPKYKLEVNHNIANEFATRIFHTSGSGGNGLLIESDGGDQDDTLLLMRSDLDLTGGSVQQDFIVLSGGRTGIAHTNPNTLTKLDVNGYMIGQNFLFSAFSTTESADFSDGIINFTEENDPHSNYATNTYTAPVNGFYYVSTNIVFDGGDGTDDTMNLRFLKNGATAVNNIVINPRFISEEGKEVNVSHNAIVQLNAGETIAVSITGVTAGSPVDYGRRNFIGYLISK